MLLWSLYLLFILWIFIIFFRKRILRLRGGEGCSIVAFNIDLHRLDYSLLERLALAQENSYIPMFNPHEMVSNAFCFKLCSDLTKFAIEFLYKKHFFKKSARNFLHSLTKNINKKDFFVDRNLYNLSENWNVISSYQNHSSSNFPAYPKVIYIGLLNVCNIGCPTCPWFSKEHSKTLKNSYFDIIRKLDRVAIETILDYASEGDCRLVFSGPGEPLLEENLLEYIKSAQQKGISQIEVATNGLLLTREKMLKMVEYGVSKVSLSIAFSNETYLGLADDTLEKYKETLQSIFKELLEKQVKIEVYLTIMYEAEYVKDFLEFLMSVQEYSFIVYSISVVSSSGIKGNIEDMGVQLVGTSRHTCSSPLAALYIFPDGSVGLCDRARFLLGRVEVEELSIGSIYKQDLSKIWNGAAHKKIVKHSLEMNFDELSQCKSCNKWWNEMEMF